MRPKWLWSCALAVAATSAVVAAPATAAAQVLTPLADVRVRYENAEQDGIIADANALTVRARLGAEVRAGEWSLLAEGEATLAPVDRYDSGVNGKTRFPLVADPENVELNRLQIQYRGIRDSVVTAGRQRIALDDQRFVGPVGWRQNEQTFDAIRFESTAVPGVRTDLTYAWSVRTIWGIDGRGARQQAISGGNIFANAAWTSPLGKFTGFAYLVDQDEAAVQNYQLSSQTYGVRLEGERNLGRGASLNYALSYARQSDYRRNPNDYSADYVLAEAALRASGFTVGLAYERLGADRGLPFTSFQTPLATLHKFQGWADKFTVTPPNGVEDLYGSIAYTRKRLLGFDAVTAAIIHHRFESARLDQRYGREWDAQLSAKRGRWTVTAKAASYQAIDFATDTRKLWLQLEWAY